MYNLISNILYTRLLLFSIGFVPNFHFVNKTNRNLNGNFILQFQKVLYFSAGCGIIYSVKIFIPAGAYEREKIACNYL